MVCPPNKNNVSHFHNQQYSDVCDEFNHRIKQSLLFNNTDGINQLKKMKTGLNFFTGLGKDSFHYPILI